MNGKNKSDNKTSTQRMNKHVEKSKETEKDKTLLYEEKMSDYIQYSKERDETYLLKGDISDLFVRYEPITTPLHGGYGVVNILQDKIKKTLVVIKIFRDNKTRRRELYWFWKLNAHKNFAKMWFYFHFNNIKNALKNDSPEKKALRKRIKAFGTTKTPEKEALREQYKLLDKGYDLSESEIPLTWIYNKEGKEVDANLESLWKYKKLIFVAMPYYPIRFFDILLIYNIETIQSPQLPLKSE